MNRIIYFIYSLSIRTKIFIMLLGFSLLIILFMSINNILNDKKIVEEMIDNSIHSYIVSNENIVVSNIIDNNQWELFKFIKNLSQNKFIKNVYLLDENNNLIMSSDPKIKKIPVSENLLKYEIKSFNFTIGTILIEKDINYINELTLKYTINTLLIFAFVLSGSVFLSIFVSKRILKRIEFIKENLKYISEKKWYKIKKPNFKENDEITELLNASYQMSKELQQYIEEIDNIRRFYDEILTRIDNIVIVCQNDKILIFSNKDLNIKCVEEIFIDKNIYEKINEKLKEINSYTIETKIKLNNKEKWSIINITSYKDMKIFTISDISEIKKLQEQYNIAQRLSMVGNIGATLAHELKNMLLPLNLYLEDISSLDEEDKEIVKNILKKMNNLIKSFLNFTKPPLELSDTPINISSLMEEILFIMSPMFEKNKIKLNKYIEENIYYPINQNAFEIVVINVIKNAIEASEEGSKIDITLKENNEFIELMVKDYGEGIPSEIKDKLFEPFFTTKENGTGLGLSTVYRIVYENNGEINVDSGEDGTTFIIRFYKKESSNEVGSGRRPNRSFEIFGKIS